MSYAEQRHPLSKYYASYVAIFREPLIINGFKYRESSSLVPNQGQMALQISPETWNHTLKPYYTYPTKAIFSPWSQKDYIVRTGKEYCLDKVHIRVRDTPKWLVIAASAGSKPLFRSPSMNSTVYTVRINTEVVTQIRDSHFRVLLRRRVYPGQYEIHSTATTSSSGAWCVCPSLGDGFQIAHQLAAWTEEEEPIAIKTRGITHLPPLRTTRSIVHPRRHILAPRT